VKSTDVVVDPAQQSVLIRERLYAGLTSMSVMVVLAVHAVSNSAGDAAVALSVAVLGLAMAGLFADFTAHTAAYGKLPDRNQLLHLLAVAGQALSAGVVPLGLIVLAAGDVLTLRHALELGIASEVIFVGAITWSATSRTLMSRSQRAVFIAAEMVVGLIVLAFKVFAH
jgi:hypothetical protein